MKTFSQAGPGQTPGQEYINTTSHIGGGIGLSTRSPLNMALDCTDSDLEELKGRLNVLTERLVGLCQPNIVVGNPDKLEPAPYYSPIVSRVLAHNAFIAKLIDLDWLGSQIHSARWVKASEAAWQFADWEA